MVFHERLGALTHGKIELDNIADPVAWLSQALEKEFTARNIPVQVVYGNTTKSADIVLTVKKFQIVSRRTGGSEYNPWETYHSFRGDVTTGRKTTDIRAYFFNGKVPWTWKAVEEACFNMPLSLLVKEIASKINTIALHYSAGDESIRDTGARAAEQAKNKDDHACFTLFELGGSNNPGALKTLHTFAENDDRFVRACALSAIGTLGAKNQFEFLQKKYMQYDEIDKYMALKSIGDAGTPQAMEFVRKSMGDPLYANEMAFKYCADLYLEK
ncbi:MAG: HEAT repeat domain-containing protein [Nitrospirota bacterium]